MSYPRSRSPNCIHIPELERSETETRVVGFREKGKRKDGVGEDVNVNKSAGASAVWVDSTARGFRSALARRAPLGEALKRSASLLGLILQRGHW
jgi:hypothetical protein